MVTLARTTPVDLSTLADCHPHGRVFATTAGHNVEQQISLLKAARNFNSSYGEDPKELKIIRGRHRRGELQILLQSTDSKDDTARFWSTAPEQIAKMAITNPVELQKLFKITGNQRGAQRYSNTTMHSQSTKL